MVYLNKIDFTYLAIDESPIGGDCSNLVIVGAESKNKFLVKKSDILIPKAGDYVNDKNSKIIENPLYYPKLEDLMKQGLDNFSWIRANHGQSFSRQLFAHASIGEIILSNNYQPQKTVLLIDTFFPSYDTKYLLHEYLKRNDFNLPIQNIECHDGGDQSIPLINFADLLAFRIGNHFRKMQREYSPWRKDPPVKELNLYRLPIKEKRIRSVSYEGRKIFSEILKAA